MSDTIKLAATGDLHVTDADAHRWRDLVQEMAAQADVIAIAGDLTNFGRTSEAELLANDQRGCPVPVVAVLGNHDFECGQPAEVTRILRDAGVHVLDEAAVEIAGIGFAGVKGYIGGFDRAELGAFGEPGIKAIVDESLAEERRLENALRT